MKQVALLSFAAVLLIQGCSVVSKEEVFGSVNGIVKSGTTQELAWIRSDKDSKLVEKSVNALLSKPLTSDNALRIALINNRALQQSYSRLGISQSELLQAGLLTNPLLGYSLGHGGGVTKSTLSVEFAFLDLLFIPLRKQLGALALEEAKYGVSDEVLKVVRDTKKNYIEALAAQQIAKLNDEALKSSETSLQLAVRQHTAGNLPKREMLKIQNEYHRSRIDSIRLYNQASIAREALNKAMGLYAGQTHYELDGKQLVLPSENPMPSSPEKTAMENRPDIAAAKKAVEYAAKEAGYTENTRLLQDATLFAESEKSSAEERFSTFGIKVPIPIFDFGQGRVSAAQERYSQSVHRLYELAVNVRSQVREESAKVRYAYDTAREHLDGVLKTDQDILKETQSYYNGMLDGIYELLGDQRRAVQAKIDTLAAVAEYKKAQLDLSYALGVDYMRGDDETR